MCIVHQIKISVFFYVLQQFDMSTVLDVTVILVSCIYMAQRLIVFHDGNHYLNFMDTWKWVNQSNLTRSMQQCLQKVVIGKYR